MGKYYFYQKNWRKYFLIAIYIDFYNLLKIIIKNFLLIYFYENYFIFS